MLPLQRDLNTHYRISIDFSNTKQELYEVYYYTLGNDGNVAKQRGFYAWEALPEWLQTCIACLDAAGNGHTVPGIGYKYEKIYWVNGQDT
jgi:hypothetical protein